MQPIIVRVINKVCCEKMQKMLDKKIITHHVLEPTNGHNAWNFYWGDEVIFYCPFCRERCF